MFSRILATTSNKASRTVFPDPSGVASSSSFVRGGAAMPLSRAMIASCRATKSSHRATGSVSQKSGTMMPRVPAGETNPAMRPSLVARSTFASATFWPCLRRISRAASTSPPESCRAFLQTIMGNPVSSRSSLTTFASTAIDRVLSRSPLACAGPETRKKRSLNHNGREASWQTPAGSAETSARVESRLPSG